MQLIITQQGFVTLIDVMFIKGHFTPFQSVREFLATKGLPEIFKGFLLGQWDFQDKCTRLLESYMLLDICHRVCSYHLDIFMEKSFQISSL